MKSPFETLGLLPSLVGRLGDDQLVELVRDAARALQLVHHPDKSGGDAFKSAMINQAATALGTSGAVKDSKKEYAESGPGQKEIDEAETELLVLQARLHALRGNINRTIRPPVSLASSKDKNEDDKKDYWVTTFYWDGPDFGVIPLDNQDPKDFTETQATDVKLVTTFQLRRAPGMKFRLATDIGLHLDLKSELRKLRQEDRNARPEEDSVIELAENSVKEEMRCARNAKSEKTRARHKEEAVKQMVLVSDMKKLRKGRAQKIRALETELKSASREIWKEGEINESGYVILDGEPTGLRVIGSSSEDGASITSPWLEPLLANGQLLYAADSKGKLKNLGVILDLEENPIKKPEEKPLVIEQNEEAEMDIKEPRKAVAAEKTKPAKRLQVPAEKTDETALAVRKGTRFVYSKSPFEAIGLLPALVAELSSEDLRTYIRFISKSLKRALHPDVGGDNAEFAGLMGALDALEKPEVFDRAKAEYATSKPGQGTINVIGQLAENVKTEIRRGVQELARAKIDVDREAILKNARVAAYERYMRLMLSGIYKEDTVPEGRADALFLHKSSGAVLSVLMDGITLTFKLESHGFDVHAVSEKPRARMRLLGSTPPDKFNSLAEAKASITQVELYDSHLFVYPVLYEKGYLVAIRDGRPEPLGMIEKIDITDPRTGKTSVAAAKAAEQKDMKDLIEKGRTVARKMGVKKARDQKPELKKKQHAS